MSIRIKLTKKVHKILNAHFKYAPKTYEEALLKGKTPPIPKGIKYSDFDRKHAFLINILEKHENETCECKSNSKCLYQKYVDKEVSGEDISAIFGF